MGVMQGVYCYETADSPTEVSAMLGNSGSALDYEYHVVGTADEGVALEAILSKAAGELQWNGELMILQSVKPKRTGPTSWKGIAHYGPETDQQSQDPPAPGTWHFDWDTNGGTHKITQSKKTISRSSYSDGADPAPELGGAIGYDGKTLHGVEIVVPKLEFGIKCYYEPRFITTAFVCSLGRNTGKTNSAPWLDFAAGELLFLGSSGSGEIPLVRGQRVKPIEVTFKFAASENKSQFTIGGTDRPVTIPGKKGWEYLWVKYQKTFDSGKVYPMPVHAYVERIYDEFNFAALFGFGG